MLITFKDVGLKVYNTEEDKSLPPSILFSDTTMSIQSLADINEVPYF
jgi:hypothetical protein